MGTVGISFGSPTSGAGFDVSSTVSQIVGNLQNVETPWKTQLTSLESQDTAISSLGTLFSNLSNDMSSLTDLEGILSEKTGSSSDTNVLTLTAADSTALAGTHTVSVTNLATTSSGYMAEVSNASDKLSGSVTLQAGSGAAQTITISSDNTLSGLAAAINSSGVGITASVLTDASGSRLSLVSGSSGANGNITVSSNSVVAAGAQLNYSGSMGTTGVASTGMLTGITNAGDTLTGSLSIQVGSGTEQTITISSDNTLSALAGSINTAAIGVTASVVVNSDGSSSLSLLSGTTGTAGTLTVASKVLDTSDALGYISTVNGENANLTVDGISLTSASNTVANLIPGVTMQLLAPSATETGGGLEQVQVVIGNDNTNVESTVNQFVTDYNSLVSAINTQDGNTTSGTPEPLFGSPTLSLLQQQLLGGLNTVNPNGSLASISDAASTTLSGSMSISVAGGTAQNIVIGPGTSTVNTIYTGSGSGNNTLSGVAAAINAANIATSIGFSDAGTTSATTADSGTLTATASDALSGSMTIQVGSGTAENIFIGAQPTTGAAINTFYTGSGVNTLSGVAAAIQSADIGVTANVITDSHGVATLTLTSGTVGSAGALTVTPTISAAGLGVTASVVTINGESSLTLTSQTAGSSGALSVSSSIVATTEPTLGYSDTGGYTSTTADTGTMTGIANTADALAGTLTIQVGSGAARTISVPPNAATSPSNNLSGLAGAINAANIGVTASVVTVKGLSSLQLSSGIVGSAGALTVTSSILDTTNTSSTTLNYTNSSDINSLTGLGISVNNDGSIAFDAATLDSVLNSNYTGVVGFFQNSNSWGQNFSTMLTNSGTTAGTGILALASSSNSNIESTLNADISKEDLFISAQQVSLTNELNQANQILQELPSQLDGVNELYSAITGYDQNSNG
jgi:flagellar hook-associated protein 2